MSTQTKKDCTYTAETHHSDDILAVWSGKAEPDYICGYHEQRFGVPQPEQLTKEES